MGRLYRLLDIERKVGEVAINFIEKTIGYLNKDKSFIQL